MRLPQASCFRAAGGGAYPAWPSKLLAMRLLQLWLWPGRSGCEQTAPDDSPLARVGLLFHQLSWDVYRQAGRCAVGCFHIQVAHNSTTAQRLGAWGTAALVGNLAGGRPCCCARGVCRCTCTRVSKPGMASEDAAAQERAARALATSSEGTGQPNNSVRDCGGVAALVALLAPGGSAAEQEQAAVALNKLCVDNTQNCDSVRECGGIAALVALLAPGGPAAVQEAAAMALRNLCSNNAQNRDSVRVCGGIAALIGLLAPGRSAGVQGAAAGALCNLCFRNVLHCDIVRECGGIAALSHCWRPAGQLPCTSRLQGRCATCA